MSDNYAADATARNANLRNLNKAARERGAPFGYRGTATGPMDGTSDLAVLELQLKRGRIIPIEREYAGTVAAVDVSGPIRDIMRTRPDDAHRALYEIAPQLREQYAGDVRGRFVSAADDIDPQLVKAFAEILEADE